jgi:hypothetical protein
MKKVLMLTAGVLMVANVAMADHFGLYTDGSGGDCHLTGPGFNTTAAVVEKFTLGSTGCRFYLDVVNAPGTLIFAFATPFVPVGDIKSDLSVGYGGCQGPGSVVVGTMVIQLGGSGYMDILPATGFPNILYTDCNFAEKPATGGRAWINNPTGQCNEVATQPSTWGQVKALYR